MSSFYLGLDSSTQSLTGVVIDLESGRIDSTHAINFEKALPHYHTEDGVLRSSDPKVIHAPPMMWLDALDALFDEMKKSGVPLGLIKAISGSGQQHGSVYLNASAKQALSSLDSSRSLSANLRGIFSRSTAPIWMDSSTSRQCGEITENMKERGGIIEATGSAAIERFTASQIRKFWQEQPEAYEQTHHIALVSSFMCSVLSGRIAPIDPGDGAGMNLMDIRRFTWHPGALSATAPELERRLPELSANGSIMGTVSKYFVERYGLNREAASVIWSGDNPCSVAGLGLIKPGMVAISMGTSHTYFGTMKDCFVDTKGEGHVFGCPTGGYMTLNCFKNGGLARARIRDQYGLDWNGYRQAMTSTPPGNHGRLMLPWFDTEIVPKVLQPGVRRLGLSEDDVAGNCRALVEGQMMAMRLHAEWMKTPAALIYATGGASEDRSVLQIMANVFQCPVQQASITKSAATGAALIAAQAATGKSWESIVQPFMQHLVSTRIEPDPATASTYEKLLRQYAQFEQDALANPISS